jgi:hypothetical protein
VAKHHHAIADAIGEQDEVKASELMREHLDWLEPQYRRVWRGPGERRVEDGVSVLGDGGSATGLTRGLPASPE